MAAHAAVCNRQGRSSLGIGSARAEGEVGTSEHNVAQLGRAGNRRGTLVQSAPVAIPISRGAEGCLRFSAEINRLRRIHITARNGTTGVQRGLRGAESQRRDRTALHDQQRTLVMLARRLHLDLRIVSDAERVVAAEGHAGVSAALQIARTDERTSTGPANWASMACRASAARARLRRFSCDSRLRLQIVRGEW